MKRFGSLFLALILGALMIAPLPAVAVDEDPGPSCRVTWGSAARQASQAFGGSVTDVRTGRQDCYDRLVIDVSGAVGGYAVNYVDQVAHAGSGAAVPLRGAGKLQIVIRATALAPNGSPTYNPADNAEAANVAGYPAFRQVAYAGTSAGNTVVGLGVADRLPFRVLALPGPGAGSRLVIDVAHAWLGAGTTSASPFGNYESARAVTGGIEIKGWMIDPDTVNPIYAWVTVDGVGRHVYANATRADVGSVYPSYGPAHGFFGVIPVSPGSHTVCITASNVGLGSHTNLGCRTVTPILVLSGSPFGNYESARAVVGGVEIKGWMIDPDTVNPIYAWVTVDGVGRHVYANTNRADVGAVYPTYGPAHGLFGTVAAAAGTRKVCVTAANVGAGSHKDLGCRTVTVTGISPSLLGTDWERIPTTSKVVALTFDGGSGDGAVASILSTLAAKNVRATFYMTGAFARAFPARVAAMAAGGHRLGNHSDTHASYPTLTNAQITADLARAEASIVAASGGAVPKPLFRFPFGDRTAADIAVVNGAGYVPVRWTVDTLGWQGTSGGRSADSVLQKVVSTLTPGQIVLLHVGAHPTDGSTLDADALPRIIDELRARGYSFVTLDALLATP